MTEIVASESKGQHVAGWLVEHKVVSLVAVIEALEMINDASGIRVALPS